MASVVLGRMHGPAGFGKTVAIKRLHAQFAKDPDFVSMFLDEARVTSGLSHPNIVMTLDVIQEPGELLLVMEYVHGAALSTVQRSLKARNEAIPPRIAAAIIAGALHGLHAAHEATDETGHRLEVVHRDVSPQNILISTDGITKIADFGIAKAAGQLHSTSEGVMKGKFGYMAPEQARSEPVTAKTDIFAAGIVLWELLTSERLIGGTTSAERLMHLLTLEPAAPSVTVPGLPAAFDRILGRALAKEPEARFPTARAMAMALETETEVANASELAAWLKSVAAEPLKTREDILSEMQRQSAYSSSPDLGPASLGPGSSTGPGSAGADAATVSQISVSEQTVNPIAASTRPATRTSSRLVAGGVVFGGLAVAAAVIGIRVSTRYDPSSAAQVASDDASPSMTYSATDAALVVATSASAAPATVATPSASVATTLPPTVVASAPARPRTASPPTVVKPEGKGKCKIEVAVDANGRTQFKEVCAP